MRIVYKTMTTKRDFIKVTNDMLMHIPETDDELKKKIEKAIDKYFYMAPEVSHRIWFYTQNILSEHFSIFKDSEVPEWGIKILRIWAGTENGV